MPIRDLVRPVVDGYRLLGLLAIVLAVLGRPMSLPAQEAEGLDELSRRLDAAEQQIRELDPLRQSLSRFTESTAGSDEELAPAFTRLLEKESLSEPGVTVDVFGRMHLEGLFFPQSSPGIGYFENPSTGAAPEDRIQFRRIRIGAQGQILQTGLYRVEFDFGNPSITTFRDVYVGFEELPYLQTLLIGNQKRPFGLDSWNSNQHVIFLERPLVVNAFNPNYRRIGIQTYGHTENNAVNWQLGVFEVPDVKAIGHDIESPLQLSYNARVSGTPWYDESSGGRGYLHLGVSNMFADTNPNAGSAGTTSNQAQFRTRPELQTSSFWLNTGVIAGGTSYDVAGLEAVLNVGSLQIQSEYMNAWVQRNALADLSFGGGYVQAAYVLTGEHEPWNRQAGRIGRLRPFENFFLVDRADGTIGSGWGAWQIAARWSVLSLSDKDVQGGRQQNVTLGLNWYWTPYSKVVFNLVNGQIRDRAPIGGYTAGNFTGAGLRFMMDF